MAIVLMSSGHFDFRNIDLYSVFNGASLTLSEAASTQVTSGIGFTVGSVNNIINGGVIYPDVHVTYDVATADSFQLWATNPDATYIEGAMKRMAGAWYGTGGAINIVGFTLNLASFFDAAVTVSTADDLLMWRTVFKGNDYVGGSTGNDTMFLARGNDIYFDQGGQDLIHCGTGNDFATIGNQNGPVMSDTVFGGAGDDILRNIEDGGLLRGWTGNDTLISFMGNDTMVGGEGADVFVFETDFGTHVIRDFDPTVDRIVAPEQVGNFGDLVLTQHGTSVWVSSGGWTVILRNVQVGDLDSGNVLLGGQTYSETVRNAYLDGYNYTV